jgi:hypothetical protein
MHKVDYLVCPAKTPEERDEWENETLEDMNAETTDIDKVDYYIDKDCKIPISYAMCKTEEDFVDWYSHHHPKLPQDIVMIAARATANPTMLPDIPQKKPPAPKKAPAEFSITHGEITVDLD